MLHKGIVLSWLAAVPFIADSEGQEGPTYGPESPADSPAQESIPRIVWQQELDDEIRSVNSEPAVGISPDTTRANPVRMVSTFRSVYLFDREGRIERRIPLKWDPIPEEVRALNAITVQDYIRRGGDKRFFIAESAVTDPEGRFYLIRREKTRGYDGIWTESIRGFSADGSLRFELRNGFDEQPPVNLNEQFHLSPSGEYMVMFYDGTFLSPFAFFDLYETTTGTRLRHVSDDDFRRYDFEPWNLRFSEDGSHVMLEGSSIGERDENRTRALLAFDGQGNLIQDAEGVRGGGLHGLQGQLSMKQEAYRQLVDPEIPIAERPEEVRNVKMLKDGNRGVYTRGSTLYLFELQPSP